MKCKSIMKILFFMQLASLFLLSDGLKAQSSDSVNNVHPESINDYYLIDYESNNALLKFMPDDRFQLWSNVLLGIESAIFSTNTLNPIGDGVALSNARVSINSRLLDNWRTKFEVDFYGSSVSLKDFYFMYEINNINLKAGNYNEPFSMEKIADPQYRTFINPTMISAMAPGRHLGISGSFKGDWYMASGGVFFNYIGDIQPITTSQTNNQTGMDEGYSFTGRAVVNPVLNEGLMIHVGIGGSYRTEKTNQAAKYTYRYSSQSLSGINKKRYIDTDLITEVDYTLLSNIELAAMYSNISFQAEYINNGIFRKNNKMMYVIDGFYAQASVLIFGSEYVYNQAEGIFVKPNLTNPWGELELALRYDYTNANGKNARLFGGAGEGYTAAINWRANNYISILLNYSYVRHDRYANGAGQYYIYEDNNGVKYADIYEMEVDEGKAGEKFSIISLSLRAHF